MVIFKAALASQRRPSCPYKPLSFQTLRHPQFLSNFQSPKFKFSVSGKKNVRLFGVMTKTSVLSDKNVPLICRGVDWGAPWNVKKENRMTIDHYQDIWQEKKITHYLEYLVMYLQLWQPNAMDCFMSVSCFHRVA